MLHHFQGLHRPWPVTCTDCGGAWFAAPLPGVLTGGMWVIYDRRAVELVHTGPLSKWRRRVTLRRDRDASCWTANGVGLMLVIVGHHHVRGQKLNMDDQAYDRAATLLALTGPEAALQFNAAVDGARLILCTS